MVQAKWDGNAIFSKDALAIDAGAVLTEVADAIRAQVMGTLKRRGIVVGLSGGIDSSVVAALATRALGKERVLGVFMPERDSSDDALRLGKLLANHLGIQTVLENIGPSLKALGCYDRQVEAIRKVVPSYGDGWKCKLTLPSVIDSNRINVFLLTTQAPDGTETTSRMPPEAYLQARGGNELQAARAQDDRVLSRAIGSTMRSLVHPTVSSTTRASSSNRATGLPTSSQLHTSTRPRSTRSPKHLGVPDEIRGRPPTTDTFSMPQTQEEFYFALPYDRMDLCLSHTTTAFRARRSRAALDLHVEQVERVFKDIDAKRRATSYLHARPLLVQPVPEVGVGGPRVRNRRNTVRYRADRPSLEQLGAMAASLSPPWP